MGSLEVIGDVVCRGANAPAIVSMRMSTVTDTTSRLTLVVYVTQYCIFRPRQVRMQRQWSESVGCVSDKEICNKGATKGLKTLDAW